MNPSPNPDLQSEPEPAGGGGLSGHARRISARVFQLVSTRLELLSLEFEEERRAAMVLLGWVAAGCVLAALALVLVTMAVVLALRPEWRALGAAVIGVVYAGLAGAVVVKLRRRLRERPPPFSATVAELKRDRQWIESLK